MADGQDFTLTVYSSTWCPDCRVAKRFLDEMGIEYKTIEIDKDPGAAVELEEKTGKRGIPYFVINDEEWWRAYEPGQGVSKQALAEKLGVQA